jgi:hypothetical protein
MRVAVVRSTRVRQIRRLAELRVLYQMIVLLLQQSLSKLIWFPSQ